MRTFLISCSLLFLHHFADAQLTRKYARRAKKPSNDNCVYQNKFSPATRRSFYPFNIADTIKLVAFYDREENFPIREDTLIKDSLVQVKVLNNNEVDSLTDIIYNNLYKKHIATNIGTMNMCFVPHNAILFFDKAGKLKEYILICFHCKEIRTSSNKIALGDECYEKAELLKQFFIDKSIDFGTDTDRDYGDGLRDVVAPPRSQ